MIREVGKKGAKEEGKRKERGSLVSLVFIIRL